MSAIAYMRNGIKPAPMPTDFDLQPSMTRSVPGSLVKSIPKIPNRPSEDIYIPKVMPSAAMPNHTRQVLGLKPSPFSIKTGIDPGPRSGKVTSQGFGRHHNKGLAHMITGKDKTSGPLMPQADSNYAGLNNRIPLPP